MGWRFRHSFKVIPGVRLNLSKSGLSCSVGGAPLTLNVGSRGVYGTASLPGTGISFRQHFGTGAGASHETPRSVTPESFVVPTSTPSPIPPVSTTPIQEVRSASTELLTSESLKELKRVIQMAHEEHEDISGQLNSARDGKATASRRFHSWDSGFLFKRLFKNKFAQRKAELEELTAKVEELEEQLRLTTIATQVEIAKEQAEPYFKMRDEFAALSESASIWDIKSHQATDRFHERTTASDRVNREKVSFCLGACDLIQWEHKIPHLQNINGGELFLYPGFILYRAAKEAFSVIDYHDVKSRAASIQFQEEQGVPNDSKVIGQTWAKANKDGSRDKRFVNNYQIPIVHYASLSLKSSTGLWEEFQFSNPEKLQKFLETWNTFTTSFGTTANPDTLSNQPPTVH